MRRLPASAGRPACVAVAGALPAPVVCCPGLPGSLGRPTLLADPSSPQPAQGALGFPLRSCRQAWPLVPGLLGWRKRGPRAEALQTWDHHTAPAPLPSGKRAGQGALLEVMGQGRGLRTSAPMTALGSGLLGVLGRLCVLVLSSCGEGRGWWGSCCWRPRARVGGPQMWEAGVLGCPGQVRGQDAPGRLSHMRPVPGASSWKTGPLGPEAGPLWWQRWGLPVPAPTSMPAPSDPGTWWLLLTWVGGGSSWSGELWELCLGQREVWLQPKGARGQWRGPRACMGCSLAPAESHPSAPQRPPSAPDASLGRGQWAGAGPPLGAWRRPAFWRCRRTTAVLAGCLWPRGPRACRPGLDRGLPAPAGAAFPAVPRGSPLATQDFCSPPAWCPSPGIPGPGPAPWGPADLISSPGDRSFHP